jgi:hypothetical protein
MRHNRFVRRRVVRLNQMAPALYVMWMGTELVVMPTSRDGEREVLTEEDATKRIGADNLKIAKANPHTWRSLYAKP